MAKNILITGGAGFVGSHISDALLAAGHHVRIFDNLTDQVHHTGIPKYLAEEAEFIHGDVREARAVRRALKGIDVVFHMAAAVGVGQHASPRLRGAACHRSDRYALRALRYSRLRPLPRRPFPRGSRDTCVADRIV